ncbi:MAG: hypothetical protein ABJB66_11140 [Gemmatimonadaceae bacterium]
MSGPFALRVALLLSIFSANALAQSDDNLLRLRRQSDASYQRRDFATAEKQLQQLIAVSPVDGRLWYKYALVQFRLNNDSLGLRALQNAYKLGGSVRASNAFDIARVFARRHNADSTVFWLDRALADGFVERERIRSDKFFSEVLPKSEMARLTATEKVPTERNAGWLYDLHFLEREVNRLYPSAARPSSVKMFQQSLHEFEGRISKLSDEATVAGFQRLLVTLGNGHTSVLPLPTATLPIRVLPIRVYDFDDGVWITGADGANASLIGARLVQIGTLKIAEVMKRLAPLSAGDNAMSRRLFAAQILPYELFLSEIGAAESGKPIVLRIVMRDGAERTVSLNAAPSAAPPSFGLPPVDVRTSSTPLWLRSPDKAYWLHSLAADSTLYVGYQAARDDSLERLELFAERVRDSLRTGRFRNAVIDVRQNRGGDNRLNGPLVRALIAFSGANENNHLFVLAGRGTFSAGQNFVNQLERYARPIFVGEATGSAPNFAGEDANIVLPYSRLTVTIASRWFQDSDPWDAREAIEPQLPVMVFGTDYFAGRDPVMERVLRVIQERSY